MIKDNLGSNSFCRELNDLIENNEESLKSDLISTSMTGRCLGPKKGYWEDITKRQSKKAFLNEITKLTSFANQVKCTKTILQPFEKFYNEDEFLELNEMYTTVIDKEKLMSRHKKNFTSIINYLVTTMKPNDYSNLDEIIGKLVRIRF